MDRDEMLRKPEQDEKKQVYWGAKPLLENQEMQYPLGSRSRINQIFTELMKKETELMGIKGNEYATNEFGLYNFQDIARATGQTMSLTAYTLLQKHLSSIGKAVKSSQRPKMCWEYVDNEGKHGEGLLQRFSDARNYLALLLACMEYENETKADFGVVKL